ncbi:uncharacterized protein [Clytia hemisphaerica]|uniref:uncharacterized protein n=1 Tax=Clytia hemisphaerica TaxID=252671 RepID=UPI0034D5B68E
MSKKSSGGSPNCWTTSGLSFSDKNAKAEFGLTDAMIEEGIKEGKLQARRGVLFGKPYLKLLKQEVMAFAKERLGETYDIDEMKKRLNGIRRQIDDNDHTINKMLEKQIELEREEKKLVHALGENAPPKRRFGPSLNYGNRMPCTM